MNFTSQSTLENPEPLSLTPSHGTRARKRTNSEECFATPSIPERGGCMDDARYHSTLKSSQEDSPCVHPGTPTPHTGPSAQHHPPPPPGDMVYGSPATPSPPPHTSCTPTLQSSTILIPTGRHRVIHCTYPLKVNYIHFLEGGKFFTVC